MDFNFFGIGNVAHLLTDKLRESFSLCCVSFSHVCLLPHCLFAVSLALRCHEQQQSQPPRYAAGCATVEDQHVSRCAQTRQSLLTVICSHVALPYAVRCNAVDVAH